MQACAEFEVLSGLPGYGPLPEQFSATDQGMHREGYVVRFRPSGAEEWVGNFQPSLTSYSKVHLHPDGQHIIVAAGGEGYVIDPKSRRLVTTFSGSIQISYEILKLNSLLFSDDISFVMFDASGLKWKSRRLSWDGMRNVQVLDDTIVGEGWRYDDTWYRFAVDLASGSAIGGAYDGPEY
jgi:hypothetical protein